MTRLRAPLALVCATFVAACASPATRGGPSPFDPPAWRVTSTPITLRVDVRNDHWLPMQVWVRWPRMHRFLGEVPPGTSASFQVPGDLVQRHETLQLYADAVGGADDVLSEPLRVRDVRQVYWKLHKVLRNSRANVL